MTVKAIIVRGTKVRSQVIGKGPSGAKGDPGANVMAIGLFAAASGLSIPLGTDAVRTSGYSTKGVGIADYVNDDAVDAAYVAAHPRTSFVSANGRGFRLDDRQGRRVEQLGAIGDGTTDDADALIAAHASGGMILYGDATYLSSKPIPYAHNSTVIGGRGATRVKFTNTGSAGATNGDTVRSGSGFYGLSPINSSTPVNAHFSGIWVENDNAGNLGSGFYDTGGTYLYFDHCRVTGFKYAWIFDQTEIANVHAFIAESQTFAALWVVNGSDLDPAAAGGYTNAISVAQGQINEPATVYGIVHDGGDTFTAEDINFNGCLTPARLAGIQAGAIVRCRFESMAAHCIDIFSTALSGSGVGGGFVSVSGGWFNPTTGHASINCNSAAGTLSVGGVPAFFGGGGTSPINGAGNLFELWLGATANQTGSALYSGTPVNLYDTTGSPILTAPATVPGTGFIAAPSAHVIASSSADGDVATLAIDHGSFGGEVYIQSLVAASTGFSKCLFRTRAADVMGERARLDETGFNITTAGGVLKIAGTQVVGARKTGWALDTGTAKRTANATYSGTAGAAYSQATLQTLMDAVRDLSQTVKAMKDDLHATAGHGLIGA